LDTIKLTGMVRLMVAGTGRNRNRAGIVPGGRPVGFAVNVRARGEYPEAGVTTSQAGAEEACATTTVELGVPVGSVTVTLLDAGSVALPT